ncbi:hypothetical protein LUZ60_011928 [Juncus effusus]|nr:hypothetical protein LUZ60_011928 [Juncus effusus]
MEKPPRSKGSKILKLLAKSTSFTNPSSTTKFRSFNHHKGFSGPIIPLVPAEARRKENTKIAFETEEPTSPKISCIGQIKHKAKKTNNKLPRPKSVKKHTQEKIKPSSTNSNSDNSNIMKRIFVRKSRSRRVLDVSKSDKSIKTVKRAPSIGHMRRFKSGRESLKDFDWRQFENKVEDQDDDMSLYYSAPLVLGGGVIASEPRKEVNLWKRRTMSPPTPLKLDDI